MMKKNITISLLVPLTETRFWVFVILTLLFVQSHAQSARASVSMSPEQSLRSTSLSSLQFQAYSDRTIGKIDEWLTYMSLLNESREDSLLFAELSSYIAELFFNNEVLLSSGQQQLPLVEWLGVNQKSEQPSVYVSRHEWIDDWAHNGEYFQRHLMVNLATLEGELCEWAGERVFTICLTRIKKDFGDETIETWEVRLGGME